MHAPYAAQYCVIGGSGAGSGGSFTLDAAFACEESAIAFDAPSSAFVADADVAVPAEVALAGFAAEAPVADAEAAVATGALAPGAVVAAGMLALIGAAEKVLGGNGGRDGTPVDEALVAGGLGGGICGWRVMSTLVCRVACA